MKVSALLAAFAVSLAAVASAQAQTPAPTPAPAPTTTPAPIAPAPATVPVDFATQKANILTRMDQRMAAMTAARDCVNSANTKADLKACHKDHGGKHGKHHQRAPA